MNSFKYLSLIALTTAISFSINSNASVYSESEVNFVRVENNNVFSLQNLKSGLSEGTSKPHFTPRTSKKNEYSHGGITLRVKENGEIVPFGMRYNYLHTWINDPKEAYLELTNTTKERLRVIFSFNRINPLTGEEAILKDKGYIINPEETIVLKKGKLHKKDEKNEKDLFAEFFLKENEGNFSLAIFKERRDYPLIVNGESPPFTPDTYVKDESGIRWVPPRNYPFRAINNEPEYRIYATFSLKENNEFDNETNKQSDYQLENNYENNYNE